MSRGLVVLVNPNKVYPPVAPYGLDVLTTALEGADFEVEVLDLTFHREDWKSFLAEYFAHRSSPLLVGVSIRNLDTGSGLEQRPFLVEHKEIITEIMRLTGAPIVGGGIGFSVMPFALVEYFGIDYGVKGPGEQIICDLADALVTARDTTTVAGLIRSTPDGVVRVPPAVLARTITLTPGGQNEDRVWQVDTAGTYVRRSGHEYKVDNLRYYQRGGMAGILTKNGCTFRCAHCVEPDAKGTRFGRRDVPAVVDEMESLCAQGILDQHTTDSEFNLSIAHAKNVLREIVRRRHVDPANPLNELRLWVYCQPTPFDKELAELLAAAGCRGVNVGADHVRPEMLRDWKVTGKGTNYYTFDDVAQLVWLCHANGIKTMVEALFGMPGETHETMRDCVKAFLALEATVTSFGFGLRLYPHHPLGKMMAERCDGVRTLPGLQSNTATEPIVLKPLGRCASVAEYERQFVLDDHGNLRLVCYFSPELAEDEGTVTDPAGKRARSVRLLWDLVDRADHFRVMLPTLSGDSDIDSNYADNSLLTSLTGLGYTGAFWAHWRERDDIMRQARANGLV